MLLGESSTEPTAMAEAPNLEKQPPIRDASTLVIVRMRGKTPEVLMGERSSGHAFFPHHYVFPGGRVDRSDGYVNPATPLRPEVLVRLSAAATPRRAQALALAAVRETFEETGLVIGAEAEPPKRSPKGWGPFYETGYGPALDGLTYIYRAVTPPARTRRFNARFFAAEYDRVTAKADIAEDELLQVNWRDFDSALALKIRPITAMVLNEIKIRLDDGSLYEDRPVKWVKTGRGGKRVTGVE
jgi:8-oxo-dGTP pyrophosphatase MutT (NUDIX family)